MSIDQITSDPLLFYTTVTAVTVVLTMAILAGKRRAGRRPVLAALAMLFR